MKESDVDKIGAGLRTERELEFMTAEFTVQRMRQAAAENGPIVALIEPIAIYRVIREIGEVGKQIQSIVNGVEIQLGDAVIRGAGPIE